ncbi:MAG: nuclear transport factor 2 family protein [Burkholderiaceae bacterium]|nr:nuclear transport factor 2 family protein [Burkholderiaceae bacterium]
MSKSHLRAATVGGSADEVEAAFYEALQAGDLERLMACWANEEDIICVHPGGPRLIGAVAIRNSFEIMFSHGPIRSFPERLHKLETITSAVHNLIERVEIYTADGAQIAFVTSTNVYMRTAQGWRMVAHHASPGTPPEIHSDIDTPTILH